MKWKSKLPVLENLAISRFIKPAGFGEIKRSYIHHFLNASDGKYSLCLLISDSYKYTLGVLLAFTV